MTILKYIHGFHLYVYNTINICTIMYIYMTIYSRVPVILNVFLFIPYIKCGDETGSVAGWTKEKARWCQARGTKTGDGPRMSPQVVAGMAGCG